MKTAYQIYEAMLTEIEAKGLRKTERILSGPQGTMITPAEQKPVLNLCANNYLGLADRKSVV